MRMEGISEGFFIIKKKNHQRVVVRVSEKRYECGCNECHFWYLQKKAKQIRELRVGDKRDRKI